MRIEMPESNLRCRGAVPAPAPLRVQLRSFIDDPAATAHIASLVASIDGCGVETVDAARAAQLDLEAFDGGGEDRPQAVVLLAGGSGTALACATRRLLQARWPAVPLFLLAQGVADAELASLVGSGASDFAALPCPDAELRLRLCRVLGLVPPRFDVADDETAPCDAQWRMLRARLIGDAPAFVKLVRRVPGIAGCDASVLLQGETGTGKEVFAQAIHYQSARARGPWVAINCAAIPPDLVEDELFGHVRGAYTHALGARQGLVRQAEGGTLLLDEIDSMPLAAQAKLLRFLQDLQYRAVGASQVQLADVRVIAASGIDLRLATMRGSFRSDLYFRLAALCLTLPPLRERRGDIAPLAMHFLSDAGRQARRRLAGFTPAALRLLLEHAWPGNVRELMHVVQRAALTAQGPSIQACDIELDGNAVAAADEAPISFRQAKARVVQTFEREYLETLLAQSSGNINLAARAAQKNRRAFFELLRRHSIDAARFRA